MADTMQIVRWALGYGCPLRPPESASDPSKALTSIARAHTYAWYAHPSGGFGVFGDVCHAGPFG